MLGSRYADYGKIKSKTALVLDGEDIGEIVNSAAANLVMSFRFSARRRTPAYAPRTAYTHSRLRHTRSQTSPWVMLTR